MMLPLMLYMVLIASAFTVLATLLESSLARLRLPRRWAWTLALGGSLLLPAAVLVRPGTETAGVTMTPTQREAVVAAPSRAVQAQDIRPTWNVRWPEWPERPDWDIALAGAWICSAGGVWLWLALSSAGLRRIVRKLAATRAESSNEH